MSFSSDVISKIEYVCAAAYSNKKGFTLNMNPYSFSRMSDLKTATIIAN